MFDVTTNNVSIIDQVINFPKMASDDLKKAGLLRQTIPAFYYIKLSHIELIELIELLPVYVVKLLCSKLYYCLLTHWGRVAHICVGNLIIIGLDNGLSPGRRQAIIWTNAGILLIGRLGTNFSEILIEIQTSSLKKKRLKSRLRNVVHFVLASMC